jgi:peptidoglycan/xylan/chitin deacetylase (PgdA/CDA1 family)
VKILTYHSISEDHGPTAIGPDVFRRQLATLEDLGYGAVSLSRYLAACDRGARSVVLTFDDGFEDFAALAWPEILARGWTCTVFVPAAKAGGISDWDRLAATTPRTLMSWEAIAELARRGVEVGSHGSTHVDLTTLSLDRAREEIVGSKLRIERETGAPVAAFAYPYGRSSATVRAEVARHYAAAVGTDLDVARPGSNRHALPRIDMWYFQNPRRWRRFLERGTSGYFTLRRGLRRLRERAAHG